MANAPQVIFCLIKMFIGEPVSVQFSRILFSRKRL